MANNETLHLNNGDVRLPAFFPDATFGSVRCVDSADLAACGTPGVVMNCYHLLAKPGLGVLRHAGGARGFSGWGGPVLTDSGGFQVFSLIRENPKFGEIRKNEIIFKRENGEKIILSPEKCIQAQFACGSDIMMCLDYCSHPEDPYELTLEAVETTVGWAGKCKLEYEKQVSARNIPPDKRPLLFAIIQGGGYNDLRERCAAALTETGFDGYGFGGWPLTSDMRLTDDILAYTARLMPDDKIKYAMGIGKPDNVIKCAKMGYNLFDCVIPTRDARHNRLYVFDVARAPEKIPGESDGSGGSDELLKYSAYYILDADNIRDNRPVSNICGCHTCVRYSRAYLHHLAKAGDSLAYRLATIHNLYFFNELMERIRIVQK
jgi:queuine tRNA-ribosyltransferase